MLLWSMHALSCARRVAQLWRQDGRGAERAHQPDCRLIAGLLLVLPSPPLESLELGAGQLLLIAPAMAQEGRHLAQLRPDRLRRQFGCASAFAESPTNG